MLIEIKPYCHVNPKHVSVVSVSPDQNCADIYVRIMSGDVYTVPVTSDIRPVAQNGDAKSFEALDTWRAKVLSQKKTVYWRLIELIAGPDAKQI